MKVSDVLRRKGTRIITVRHGEQVEVAAQLLRKENIGALVVKDVCRTEGNVVLGMFSERDIVRALVDHGPAALRMPVSALMSRNVVTCSPHDDLDHVLRLIEQHQIRHLPVLEDDTLVGVISVRDLVLSQLPEFAEATDVVAAAAGASA